MNANVDVYGLLFSTKIVNKSTPIVQPRKIFRKEKQKQ